MRVGCLVRQQGFLLCYEFEISMLKPCSHTLPHTSGRNKGMRNKRMSPFLSLYRQSIEFFIRRANIDNPIYYRGRTNNHPPRFKFPTALAALYVYTIDKTIR